MIQAEILDTIDNLSFTENGAVTMKSSLNAVVDFFFYMGGFRNTDNSIISETFKKAYSADKNLTVKALFKLRDILSGMGERRSFHTCFKQLIKLDSFVAMQMIKYIPEYGRYKDLIEIAESTDKSLIKHYIFNIFYNTLFETKNEYDLGNAGLAAKWFPRKGIFNSEFRAYFKLQPKELRKLVVSKTSVVETNLCNKDYTFDYSHVPSQAMLKYVRAFAKNDKDRFEEFKTKVESGEVKIHTATMLPHQIVKGLLENTFTQQETNIFWNNLKDALTISETFLPVVDVSGSMTCNESLPLYVSIGLGLKLAQLNKSVFKNAMITFHESPQLVVLDDNLTPSEMIYQTRRLKWGGNTNLQAVFDLIIDNVKKYNLNAEDIPNNLLIISDMEFDIATNSRFSYKYVEEIDKSIKSKSNFEVIREKFKNSNIKMPNIIFWNVASRSGENAPVRFNENGVALISGFNTEILNSLVVGELNPVNMMLKALLSKRYEKIEIK